MGSSRAAPRAPPTHMRSGCICFVKGGTRSWASDFCGCSVARSDPKFDIWVHRQVIWGNMAVSGQPTWPVPRLKFGSTGFKRVSRIFNRS